MKDIYHEVALEFPLLCSVIPDKYDRNKFHVPKYTEFVVWISDVAVKEDWFILYIRTLVSLFQPFRNI